MIVLLALLLLPATAFAHPPHPGPQPGSLSTATGDSRYVNAAGDTTISGALATTAKIGTSGTTNQFILESTFAATGSTDVMGIYRCTADAAAADSCLSIRDNTSTVLLSVLGDGTISPLVGVTGLGTTLTLLSADGSGFRAGNSAGNAAVGSSGGFWFLANAADAAGFQFTARTTTGDDGFRFWNIPNTAANGFSDSSGTQHGFYFYTDTRQSGTAAFSNMYREFIYTSLGSGAVFEEEIKAGATSGGLAAIRTMDKSGNVILGGGIQPGAVESTTPAIATTFGVCAAGLKGRIVYWNDTDDAAVAQLCVCRQNANDSAYQWTQVVDNTTACP